MSNTCETKPKFTVGEHHGDIHFVAECDGEVLRYSLGWGHGGPGPGTGNRSQYPTQAVFSAYGFGLYVSGDLHDGHRSIREMLDDFDDVYLTLDDYKAGRSLPFEEIVDACRAWAKLPPLASTPTEEIEGEVEADV